MPGFVRTDLATCGYPNQAAAADFNRDGKLDMVTAGASTCVLLGNGDGTFGAPITAQANTDSRALAVGDLNGDGIPDLVTNGINNNLIYVQLGNGDGTFQTATTLSGAAVDMALGDFNGDGKLDLVFTEDSSIIFVYPGNGDGTFGTLQVIHEPQSYAYQHIKAVDLNGDGKLDLVMTEPSVSGQFSVVLGNGDGTFQPVVNYANAAGTFLPVIAVADVNGDRILDVVLSGGAGVGVSLGKGDGTFLAPVYTPVDLVLNGIVIGDVNGDGKPDLLAAEGTAYAAVLLGNGDGTFTAPVTIPTGGASSIAAADFNRDGRLDLLTANSAVGTVSLLQNTGLTTCIYSIGFPFTGSIPDAGTSGTATVSTPSNCSWTAVSSDPSWLHAFAVGNQGSGQVILIVDPNIVPAARSATVTIADQTFTVNQDSDVCGVVLSSPLFTPGVTLVTIGSEGTVTSFTITVAPGCTWTATSQLPQVTLSSYSGTGTSTISVTLAPNTGQETFPGFSIGPQLFQFDELGNQQDFSDVLPSAYYFTAVNLLQSKNITAGCGVNPPLYCPTQDVTRAQMAIFIVRTILGTDVFPYSPTPYFTDVPTGSFGFAWIQKLKDLGITAGCQTDLFCPNSTVTRDQMAVFLIRARYGASTVFDYPATPYFTDVPNTDFAFPWIQRLREDAITSGCGPSIYCPTEPVTRGDMAIFLMRAGFNQLLPPLEPVITQVSPATVGVGQTALLTITGLNTNFVQGVTVVSPIAGFTLGAVTVSSPTTLTVQVTAAATSGAQPESVLVITGPEEAVLPNALSIP